jgi:HAD superfamily hydrolase (TIGR01509 family)
MIRLLIFDFDGLILDTEKPIFTSWQELYQEHGCELTLEEWGAVIGTYDNVFDPVSDLEKKSGMRLDWDSLLTRRKERESELILLQPVLPGVKEILNAGNKLELKLAIASSSNSSWVIGHLERLGLLPYFDVIKTGDQVNRTKPDPALFLAVLEELQIGPEEAVVFEDSPNGILAARRAGIYCVVVPNLLTRQLAIQNANLRLESLAEISLDRLLERIESELNHRG